MLALACFLLYLGIVKKFEPLLLVGIAFGMLLTNLPVTGIFHAEYWSAAEIDYGTVLHEGGFLDFIYIGVKTGVYPSLIFLGVGAMTDFGPMIANPRSLLLGAAAQLGIYCAFILAILLAFPVTSPPPSASSAAPTAPRRFSSRKSWLPSTSAQLPSRPIPIWR